MGGLVCQVFRLIRDFPEERVSGPTVKHLELVKGLKFGWKAATDAKNLSFDHCGQWEMPTSLTDVVESIVVAILSVALSVEWVEFWGADLSGRAEKCDSIWPLQLETHQVLEALQAFKRLNLYVHTLIASKEDVGGLGRISTYANHLQ